MHGEVAHNLPALIQNRRVLVCCGAGGVGKTTVAAALGLSAARLGRRVLVLTVDPARRLAQAMGVSENAPAPVAIDAQRLAEVGVAEGRLDVWMLNPQVVFEDVVKRLASTPAQARVILNNRLFKALCELVAGMQEYTAAEALYGFCAHGQYDLVVLDTPPARNALDFLEAPNKLARFLDEKVVGLFLPTGGRGLGLLKKAAELVGNVLGRVLGAAFFSELQQFLSAFSGLFGPMRRHAEGVRALLSSEQTAFLLITSPEQAARAEARYFRERIREMGLPFAGFVLNRSWAQTGHLDDPAQLSVADSHAPVQTALAKLKALAMLERTRAEEDRSILQRLTGELSGSAVAVATPYLADSVEDLAGLSVLAQGLVDATA